MSILPSHSLIFTSKTTVKPYSFTSSSSKVTNLSQFSVHSSFSHFNDPRDLFVSKSTSNKPNGDSNDKPVSFVDEWGEKSGPELQPLTKLSDSDPPIDVDEWGRAETGINDSSGIEDEWGEKSFPEPRPEKTVSDSDPPIDEDEWIGAKLRKLVGKKTDRVKIRGGSDSKTTSFVDELGEKSEPDPDPTGLSESDPQPIASLPDSDTPKDKDERDRAEVENPDPTRIHTRIAPLPSLVTKLVDQVENETELVGKITAGVVEDLVVRVENETELVGKITAGVVEDETELLGKITAGGVENEIELVGKITAGVVEDETELLGKITAGVVENEIELVGKITAGVVEDLRIVELKRDLIDKVYGTDFGLRASSEVRAEVLELVSQLEAANPTPNPVESFQLLDGNWILVFTAFSELLPLLAVGTIPLLKVEKISQAISTSSLTIENSTTLSIPVANLSFSATAAFEVRSPSRIQVEFKEGTFKPPEIKLKKFLPNFLPENLDIFGQNISLSPVQLSLCPLENVVAGISRTISGLPPLKVPIPGERTKSWLITTYLDKDLRISRGDGGLFVLVKEERFLPDLFKVPSLHL